MAKNTSSKIKELKGIKPDSITEKDLNRLREVVGAVNENKLSIGNLEVQKHSLVHQSAAINERLQLLQEEFIKEYKTLDIDINTGAIKYNEDDEANKKD
tara:strand:+ start:449 stop:745 length:297 start_codon:yes stop_codon:yes gene_type:complete